MNATNSLSEWLAYIERQHPQSIAMGLERVREVATRLGLSLGAVANPTSASGAAPDSGRTVANRTIVVAGTNGKGSTVAFIEAVARAAGWRVGSYTSPHLLRYNERVRIDGNEVQDAALVAAFAEVEAARGDIALTYFEFGTLAALQLFAHADLDLAVLEVGLGGRLDAVNIVDADVAVITTVDVDHTDWLGGERESIGEEKVGIARAWTPLILGEIDPPSSVLRRAYQIGANAIRFGSDFFAERIDAQRWCWRDVSLRMELPMPTLQAPVQLVNAASAIAALRALDRPLPPAAWAEGIATAAIAGRLQAFQRGAVEVLLDVGHNPQAAHALASALQARPAAGRTHAVYAALSDKDVAGVAKALEAQIDTWRIAGLDGSRGQGADTLAERLRGTPAAAAGRFASVGEALTDALAMALAGDRVLVFGSFHTVAEALTLLR